MFLKLLMMFMVQRQQLRPGSICVTALTLASVHNSYMSPKMSPRRGLDSVFRTTYFNSFHRETKTVSRTLKQWSHSECRVSLQRFPSKESLNPISHCRWKLLAWLRNWIQSPLRSPQAGSQHTRGWKHTQRLHTAGQFSALWISRLIRESWELHGGLRLMSLPL